MKILDTNLWVFGTLLSIDSIETTERDTHAVERAALLDDIMSEATAIDDLTTLEDTLAEVLRQRRLKTTGADATDSVDSG